MMRDAEVTDDEVVVRRAAHRDADPLESVAKIGHFHPGSGRAAPIGPTFPDSH